MVGSGFMLSGANPFSGINAGYHLGSLLLSFDTASLVAGNHYVADVIFHGVGANASGYLGSIGDYNLQITGEVAAIPVPAAVWLVGVRDC